MKTLLALLLDWVLTRLPKVWEWASNKISEWKQRKKKEKRVDDAVKKLKEAKTEDEKREALDAIADSFRG